MCVCPLYRSGTRNMNDNGPAWRAPIIAGGYRAAGAKPPQPPCRDSFMSPPRWAHCRAAKDSRATRTFSSLVATGAREFAGYWNFFSIWWLWGRVGFIVILFVGGGRERTIFLWYLENFFIGFDDLLRKYDCSYGKKLWICILFCSM